MFFLPAVPNCAIDRFAAKTVRCGLCVVTYMTYMTYGMRIPESLAPGGTVAGITERVGPTTCLAF
jgi:hypothetical protein